MEKTIHFPPGWRRRTKMESYQLENIQVTPEKKGLGNFPRPVIPFTTTAFQKFKQPNMPFNLINQKPER